MEKWSKKDDFLRVFYEFRRDVRHFFGSVVELGRPSGAWWFPAGGCFFCRAAAVLASTRIQKTQIGSNSRQQEVVEKWSTTTKDVLLAAATAKRQLEQLFWQWQQWQQRRQRPSTTLRFWRGLFWVQPVSRISRPRIEKTQVGSFQQATEVVEKWSKKDVYLRASSEETLGTFLARLSNSVVLQGHGDFLPVAVFFSSLSRI